MLCSINNTWVSREPTDRCWRFFICTRHGMLPLTIAIPHMWAPSRVRLKLTGNTNISLKLFVDMLYWNVHHVHQWNERYPSLSSVWPQFENFLLRINLKTWLTCKFNWCTLKEEILHIQLYAKMQRKLGKVNLAFPISSNIPKH
jgi:hypothetical protein